MNILLYIKHRREEFDNGGKAKLFYQSISYLISVPKDMNVIGSLEATFQNHNISRIILYLIVQCTIYNFTYSLVQWAEQICNSSNCEIGKVGYLGTFIDLPS